MASMKDVDSAWEEFLSGHERVVGIARGIFKNLPSPPRCKLCNSPFKGPGLWLMKLLGKTPWPRNPKICRWCALWLSKKGPGGAEVETSLVFADVRGSTTIAEQMRPKEYAELINCFFSSSTDIIVEYDGIIDQLVGDAVIGLFLPGFAGQDYTRHAIEAAWRLLECTGHGSDIEPRLPIGVGVHKGLTYVGTVGSGESFSDFTALGDTMNTTARLASEAKGGEILVSEAAGKHGGLNLTRLERRILDLKGKSGPFPVFVLQGPPQS